MIKRQGLRIRAKNSKIWFWAGILESSFLIFCLLSSAFALSLDKLRQNFVSADYAGCITEGERILANTPRSQEGLDELYYFLGLSYLKQENYLRASDIFEIIINEFKNSRFTAEAKIGLGDSYFLRPDYDKAQSCYKGVLDDYPGTKFLPGLYYRMAQVGIKQGNTAEAELYLGRLAKEFPLSPEAKLGRKAALEPGIYYSVQVGCFSKKTNAQNLAGSLNEKGYPVYIEEMGSKNGPVYRVRIGKTNSRQEAAELERRLSKEGYPTNIIP